MTGRFAEPWPVTHRLIPRTLLFLAVLGGLIAWSFTGMFLGAPAPSVGWTLMRYWLDESRDQEAVDAQLAVMSSPTRPETNGR